jgi:hypothetical protein
MSLYDLHFNKDDVLFRNIIIGVLATLNDKIKWYNRLDDHTTQEVNVPFYLSTTGDERFLQDMFLNDVDYDSDGNIAEGVYNPIPRAIVDMESFSIMADSLVNRYVRGTYTKEEEDGTLGSYSSEFMEIPLSLPFNIDIYLDSRLDMFKCSQAIIEVFYKNAIFQVDVGGIRVPGVIKFPEDIAQERTVEFGFTDKKEWKLTLSLDVEVNYPIFLNGTEYANYNRMSNLSVYNTWGSTAGIIGPTGSTATSSVWTSNNIQQASITSNQSVIPEDFTTNNNPWPDGSTQSTLPPK